jgi:hypothetical protein
MIVLSYWNLIGQEAVGGGEGGGVLKYSMKWQILASQKLKIYSYFDNGMKN